MYSSMYVCMCVFKYVSVNIYVCVCVYVYVYVSMYVCMYLCIYVRAVFEVCKVFFFCLSDMNIHTCMSMTRMPKLLTMR